MRMAFGIDVREIVPTIAVPTLVLHRVDDAVCNVENGRFLGANIRGARFIELEGEDHAPWANSDEIIAEIREFVTGVREPLVPERILTTILFTDIVDSTATAVDLGDTRWREVLEQHHRSVRQELRRYRGREIATTGDGFLASFDGPARAIRCARSVLKTIRPVGIELRAGIHTGEVEVIDDDLGGIGVHIAARVCALAQPGELLVSRTVSDLVSGSGIVFEDRGEHQLKGVSGSWRLLCVSEAQP